MIWNDVFDAVIINAGREYLSTKSLAQQGLAPDVTVFGTMRPAAAHGVVVASLWALPIAIFGVAAVWYAARRASRLPLGGGATSSGAPGPLKP